MRFLLDENVPLRLRDSLLAKGFQVELVVEHLGIGASNHEVAEEATRIADTILTFDEDFLRLRPEIKQRVKVLYIKIHPRDPREARRLLDKWIDECVALLERGRLVKLTEKGPVLEEA